jgi:hypothetical protein
MEVVMLGIDKLNESLDDIEKLALSVGVVFEDGGIGFSDVTEVPALFSAISELVSDLPAAIEEAKDLDAAEYKVLLPEILEKLMKLASAFTKKA